LIIVMMLAGVPGLISGGGSPWAASHDSTVWRGQLGVVALHPLGMQRQELRRLDQTAVRIASEILGVHAGELAEHVVELGGATGEALHQHREDADHADVALAADLRAGLLDGEEVARAAVEVRDDHVVKALRGERAAEVAEHGLRGRRLEEQRAGMRHGVGRRVDERQLQEGLGAMAFRQEAQHPLREPLALQRIGAERQVRAVHLERRAGDQHDAVVAIE
jgi:hypothetical protein